MAHLYLDACMIIDLVEGDAEQQKSLKTALRGQDVISSELARLESRDGSTSRCD